MNPASPLPIGIFDANGIIGLAKADCLSLVRHLFSQAYVPSLVVREVTDAHSHAEMQLALGSWLTIAVPTPASLFQAGTLKSEADRQVLALGLDHPTSVIVTGDRVVANRAQRLQLPTLAPPDAIQLLARATLIIAARPCLDLMRQRGFGIPQSVYDTILRELGE